MDDNVKMMLDDYHVNRTFLWDDKQMRMGLWDYGIWGLSLGIVME
jgi:hypothetical protein